MEGIQVDFDDGHCPTWKNQLVGYQNISLAVNGKLPGAPMNIAMSPILMLRPRAWNMIEHNILVSFFTQLFIFSLLYRLNTILIMVLFNLIQNKKFCQ